MFSLAAARAHHEGTGCPRAGRLPGATRNDSRDIGRGRAQTYLMTASAPRPGRAYRCLAAGLGVLAWVQISAAAVFSTVADWTWRDALDAFVVTNAVMGLSFATCGSIIAWHRPRNPIGWLFLGSGVAQATTAVVAPLGQVLLAADAPTVTLRLLMTIFNWSWPWAIGLGIPVSLLLFPDGRALSRRWRWVVVAVIATAPLFTLEMATEANSEPGLPPPYLTLPFYADLQPLWTLVEVRGLLAIGLGLVCLGVRYRRGTEAERRQLLWLLLAGVIALAATIPWGLVAGTPIVVLFAIPLIPLAVTVAIVRHQLLDIRLIVSRALSWLLLSLALVVAYAALLALLDRFVSNQIGRSAGATVVLALLAAPLLPRLQRLVDRAMYGDRSNPASVVSQVGAQLSTPDAGLPGVVAAVRGALRLPYVALERDGRTVASDGQAGGPTQTWPLTFGGQPVGDLRLGLRAGERELSAADGRVLGVLASPIAVALHSAVMSADLQTSRERLVGAREEERRRLRRDLHDGLGPTLTGIAFSADAAANLIESDPEQARTLLDSLRNTTRAAIADVRRLVDDLRPPALDELGLVGALQRRADQLAWRADGTPMQVQLDTPAEVPALPAAVEVATYRIATEALTNVVRHSQATTARVRLHWGTEWEVSVSDDDTAGADWTPGVGLHAMAERAAELGGSFQAGPSPDGGRVQASFPLGAR